MNTRLVSKNLFKGLCPLLLVACLYPAPVLSAGFDGVQQKVREAVNAEANAQQQMDDWNKLRDQLLDEARTLKLELQWLDLQNRKFERYTQSAQKKIDSLLEAQGRYTVISMQLEQGLLEDLERFEKTVKQGNPFYMEERNTRLDFLRNSLNDPDLHIGEKFRRFVEGLSAEAEYGTSLDASTQTVQLQGANVDASLVRAGQLGYYAVSLDRSHAAIWNRSTGRFEPVDRDTLYLLRQLEETALSKQFQDISIIPFMELN